MKKRGVGLKGQVTAFIIVGIVILISISAVIYLRGRAVKKEGIELVTVPRVSIEFTPVNNYVKTCITRITDQGLKLAENRGGYLYQEGLEADVLDPTEGNAVEFRPDSGVLVPFWHYMKSPNPCTNCQFNTGIPPLCKRTGPCFNPGDGSVEEQLEQYIYENFRDCMDEFDAERLGYEITELGEPVPTVSIGDKNVVVSLIYPIKVTKDDASTEMNRFISTIRSEFTELYTMAYELTDYQMKNCFIGRHTQNYISYFMGLDKELPPLSKQTLGESNPRIWVMYDVKEKMKPKISAAMNSIGIMNTKNFLYPHADPADPYYKTIQGVLDQRIFNPFSTYHDATVFLKYLPWWDIYADIRPREGETLLPSDFGTEAGGIAQLIGSIIQMKDYTFFYQYSFPVVIDIQKTDFKGEPHTFRFGIEGNVRANRCIGNDTEVRHSSAAGGTQLCRIIHATQNTTITTIAEIYVYGYPTDVPVSDVLVRFFAGDTCLLGATDENGVLEARYPLVYGGYFKFAKEGYSGVTIDNADITDPITVRMHKVKEFNVSVLHYNITVDRTTGLRSLEGPAELIPGETVIISVEKIGEPSLMSQVVAAEGGVENNYTLKLLPDADYEITANYFNNQSHTLPANCAHMCEEDSTDDSWNFVTNTPISKCHGADCPIPGDGEECDSWEEGIHHDCCDDVNEWFPDEPMDVTNMGGARFTSARPWSLSKGVWNAGGTVVFKVVSLPEADCMLLEDCVIPGCVGYSTELDALGLGIYYDYFWLDLEPEIE